MADGRRERDDDPPEGESILDALSSDPRERRPRERRPRRQAGDPDWADVRRRRLEARLGREPGEGEDERRARFEDVRSMIAGRRRGPERSREPGDVGGATPTLRPGGATRDPHVRAERPADPELADEVAFWEDLHTITPRVFVSPLLIGLNVGVFAVLVLAFGVPLMRPAAADLLPWGANFAPQTTSGEWWRLVTSMFLHFGLLHIFFNMWVLKQVGPLVERLIGPVGFLVMYMGSGVVGSLLSTWFNPDVVSAGASGAVFGVIGALLGVLLLGHGILPRRTLSRLRSSVGTFVLLNLYLGFTVPGIDMAAHLGGLGMGLVCGLVMTRPDMLVATEGRGGRVLTALGLCGIAVVWLLVAVPEARGGDVQVFLEVDRIDRNVAEEFRGLALEHDTGDLDDRAFADDLELLVERLATARSVLAAADGSSGRVPLGELTRLVDARHDAYELLLEYLRTGDGRWLDEFDAKQRAVDGLEARLR